jgi:prepilin-type N-terminal cleavage/methylation domain-containing protein
LPRTFLEKCGKMKRVRLSNKVRNTLRGSSAGFSLIEVLIALTLVGVIAIAFLSALSTASTALITADEQATAESLARSQMEYVKNLPKSASYSPSIPPEYEQAGYSATIDVDLLRVGLQEITIRIHRHDEEVVKLVGYKVF